MSWDIIYPVLETHFAIIWVKAGVPHATCAIAGEAICTLEGEQKHEHPTKVSMDSVEQRTAGVLGKHFGKCLETEGEDQQKSKQSVSVPCIGLGMLNMNMIRIYI